MFHALSWFAVISVLAPWSLAFWALYGAAVRTAANAGALTGVASGASSIRLPEGLAAWVSPEAAQWTTRVFGGLAGVGTTASAIL